jgi:hypothetical protein
LMTLSSDILPTWPNHLNLAFLISATTRRDIPASYHLQCIPCFIQLLAEIPGFARDSR